MNLKAHMLKWEKENPDGKLPYIIDAEDFNYSQLLIGGQWKNRWYSCGVIQKNDMIYYFETDDDRGNVRIIEEFKNEEDFIKYIDDHFSTIIEISEFDDSLEAHATRFLTKNSDLTEEKARKLVEKMSAHKELFDEFYNYTRLRRLPRDDEEKVVIEGYTAERIVNEKGVTPIEAYTMLLKLANRPKWFIRKNL